MLRLGGEKEICLEVEQAERQRKAAKQVDLKETRKTFS